MKRDSEVAAASALASLYSDVGFPPSAYAYQQHMLQQMKQHKHLQEKLRQSSRQGPKKFEVPERYTKNGRKRAVPFPLKLMQVLTDEQYAHIISWMPSGRSFVILRPKAFVADVLPKHFKSAQYASFTRKLSRWGFTRCEDGTGEFFHPKFRKGRLDLAEKMKCLGHSSKSEQVKKGKAPDADDGEDSKAAEDTDQSSGDDASCASSTRSDREEAAGAAAADQASPDDEDVFSSLNLPPGKFLRPPRAMLGKKEQHLMDVELEAMRLHRCLQAASFSRKALEGMQRRGFDPAAMGEGDPRAFALAAGGYPEFVQGGGPGYLYSGRYPWRSMMFGPMAEAHPMYAAYHDFDPAHFAMDSSSLGCRPSASGSKTA